MLPLFLLALALLALTILVWRAPIQSWVIVSNDPQLKMAARITMLAFLTLLTLAAVYGAMSRR